VPSLCAAGARARNAALQTDCDDGIRADVVQIDEVLVQTRAESPLAIAAGSLKPTQWARLDRRLTRGRAVPERGLDRPDAIARAQACGQPDRTRLSQAEPLIPPGAGSLPGAPRRLTAAARHQSIGALGGM